MIYEEYIKILKSRFSKHFHINTDVEILGEKVDFQAKFSQVSGRTFVTQNDIIDRYENYENCYIKYIPESDLKLIINSMPRITQGGSYYINDKEFVQKNRLTGLYKNILDPTVMKNILDKNHEEFIAIYESAPLGQKTIINSMVFDKRLNGENVDANILMYLQNKTNIDYINIEPLLKEG